MIESKDSQRKDFRCGQIIKKNKIYKKKYPNIYLEFLDGFDFKKGNRQKQTVELLPQEK